MFELANRLVGIYKTNDTTKSVTINPHCFELMNTTTSTTNQSVVVTRETTVKNDQDDENENDCKESDTNDISPSPMMKKVRPSSKKNSTMDEENENTIKSTRKVLNYENERKSVLNDSTNKL